MSVSTTVKKYGIEQAIKFMYKDPEKNLPKLMDWADTFCKGRFPGQRAAIRRAIEDPTYPYYDFIRHMMNEVDHDVLTTIVVNFFINANMVGVEKQEKLREEHNCNIPWAILLDPTSACNLHCTGCWAAEYGNKLNLTFDEIDDIIRQGKDMGVYMYIYTGGEPLVRKADLIKLCEKHDDCIFLAFTNGTLIDEKFADDMLRVKNFVPAISLEGFEEATDSRRGDGVYGKATHAMNLLRERKLLYGISSCYTRANFESITSEEYYDSLIRMGAYFIWYFHYMPVGMGASTDLLLTPEQRTYMKNRVREIRGVTGGKELYCIDFQNDGEFAGGCVAGGRIYCHINAAGDVEPCVFIHYSGANIREKSFLECLQQPLFLEYRKGQPFNGNHLRPCPMLENPDLLPEMVKRSGARSTDLEAPESAEHLCEKCKAYAACWQPTAEQLWDEEHRQ